MNPNILISTIITSTAALVAIIGGFLVSRVITLSGEKNAIERRLQETDSELKAKKLMLDRAERVLFDEDVDGFIEAHAEEILIKKIPIKEILEEEGIRHLTVDELAPHIEKLSEVYDHITRATNNATEGYDIPSNFEDFVRRSGIKVNERRNWYEKVHWIILKNDYRRVSQGFFGGGAGAILPTLPIDPSINKNSSSIKSQNYWDRTKERNSLDDEIRILSGMKEEQQKHLSEYVKISGLWWGLIVLVYACFAGIVVPGTLWIYPDLIMGADTTHALLYIFFSGLLAIFIYLGVSIHRLKK